MTGGAYGIDEDTKREIYEAVVDAEDRGDTLVAGGVQPRVVAEELDLTVQVVNRYLRFLEVEGALVESWGFDEGGVVKRGFCVSTGDGL